jgi:hypothetical protein
MEYATEYATGRLVRTGRLLRGEGVVAADVELRWDVVRPDEGPDDWAGSFESATWAALDPGVYRLETSDGRSGEILVRHVNLPITRSQSMRVEFAGAGPPP